MVYEDQFSVPHNVSEVYMITKIRLQLVGNNAEYAAMSMAHWANRNDLIDFLQQNGACFLPGTLGKCVTSIFFNDGLNNVLAYNSDFAIQWSNKIASDNGDIVDTVNISGDVTVIN
jgi:hypothetical protein